MQRTSTTHVYFNYCRLCTTSMNHINSIVKLVGKYTSLLPFHGLIPLKYADTVEQRSEIRFEVINSHRVNVVHIGATFRAMISPSASVFLSYSKSVSLNTRFYAATAHGFRRQHRRPLSVLSVNHSNVYYYRYHRA